MEAFLGMTEIRRIPWRSQLRQKRKALLQFSMMHRFPPRDGGSGLRMCLSLLGNLQMSVKAMEMVLQETE